MITAGIDVGSITTKCAVVKEGRLLDTCIIPTGYNVGKAAASVFSALLNRLNLEPESIEKIVSTGYGRNRVANANKAVTEITCHAAGVHFMHPESRSIIDIGGQDSKAITIDAGGRVTDFIMNDKCAAGTGRFLEVMARALEVDLDAFGDVALKSEGAAQITSLCTVFAESEVIALLSQGEPRSRIIAGIHESIASRVVAMGNQVGLSPPVIMTGGVANNSGVVRAIQNKINTPVKVAEYAQANGAIGAALIAAGL